MLTETVAGRTYDYSHNVGRDTLSGMGFFMPVALESLWALGWGKVSTSGGEGIIDSFGRFPSDLSHKNRHGTT